MGHSYLDEKFTETKPYQNVVSPLLVFSYLFLISSHHLLSLEIPTPLLKMIDKP